MFLLGSNEKYAIPFRTAMLVADPAAPVGITRTYAVAEPWSNARWDSLRAADARGDLAVCSFKTSDTWTNIKAGSQDSYILGLCAGMSSLSGRHIVGFNHEPENDSGKGPATDYVLAATHVYNLMRANLPPGWSFADVLMDWTFNPSSGRDPADWITPASVAEWLMADLYNWRGLPSNGVAGIYADPAKSDKAIASMMTNSNPQYDYLGIAAAAGKRKMIAELGCAIEDPATNPTGYEKRTAWIAATMPYLRAHVEGVMWFEVGQADGNCEFAIRNEPTSMAAYVSSPTPPPENGSIATISDSTNRTSYTSGFAQPDADVLLGAIVDAELSGATPPDPTVTGWGPTWSLHPDSPIDWTGSSTTHRKAWLYVAKVGGTQPDADVLTVDFGSTTMLGCEAEVFQLQSDQCDLSGTALAAIGQVKVATGSGLSGEVDLVSPDPDSRSISAFFHNINEAVAQRPLWTPLASLVHGSPSIGGLAQIRLDALEATATASWNTAAIWGGMHIEISPTAGSPPPPPPPPPGGGLLEYRVFAAFGKGPLDAFTDADLTELTAYCRELTVDGGRQTELARTQASTCEIRLGNRSGVFDTGNASGPHYGDLVPGVPIVVSLDGVRIFTGQADDWAQDWPGRPIASQGDAEVLLSATDGFEALSADVSAYSDEVLADEPAGYWRMKEHDTSFTDGEGTFHPGPRAANTGAQQTTGVEGETFDLVADWGGSVLESTAGGPLIDASSVIEFVGGATVTPLIEDVIRAAEAIWNARSFEFWADPDTLTAADGIAGLAEYTSYDANNPATLAWRLYVDSVTSGADPWVALGAPGGSPTPASSYSPYLASPVQPKAETSYLLVVDATRGSSTDPPVPTITDHGMGLAWERGADPQNGGVAPGDNLWSSSGTTHRAIWLFWAPAASVPGSGYFTIDFGGVTVSSCDWALIELNGADPLQPVNPASIRKASGSSSSGGTITLPAASDARSRPFAAWALNSETAISPASSPDVWDEITSESHGAPTIRVETQWRESGYSTHAAASWSGGTFVFGGVACEIRMQLPSDGALTLETEGGSTTSPQGLLTVGGGWQHVGVAADADATYWYRNGALLGTSAPLPARAPEHLLNLAALVIGATAASSQGFDGRMSRFAVYESVVPEYRFGAHYAARAEQLASADAGAQISQLLDVIGWPASRRAIDANGSVMTPITFPGNVLDLILQVAEDSDGGMARIRGDGVFEYQSRLSLLVGGSASVATFGDGNGEVNYSDVSVLQRPREFLKTVVEVSNGIDPPQVAADLGAVKRFGRRVLRLDTRLANREDAADRAKSLLARYHVPKERPESLVLTPGSISSVISQIVARQPADHITVERRPPAGDQKTLEAQIAGYRHHAMAPAIASSTWSSTYDLVPAESAGVWVTGTSRLDIDTIFGSGSTIVPDAAGWSTHPIFTDPSVILAGDWNKLVVANLRRLRQGLGFRLFLDQGTVVGATNETQLIASHAGTATGGTYRIGYQGVYTPAILAGATRTEVRNALRTIPAFAAGAHGDTDVFTIAGTSLNAGWTITFTGQGWAGRDVDTLTVDYSALVGDTIDVSTLTPGGPSYVFFSGSPVGAPYPVETTFSVGDPPAPASLGDVPGLWMVNALVSWTTAVSSAPYAQIRDTAGVVLAQSQASAGNTGSAGAALLLRSKIRLEVGRGIGLYVSDNRLLWGPANTYLEAFYLGG